MGPNDSLARLHKEHRQAIAAIKQPITATIVSHDGQTAFISVPSFDGGNENFGPVSYMLPTAYVLAGVPQYPALPVGTTVLAVQDENDGYWIIAP